MKKNIWDYLGLGLELETKCLGLVLKNYGKPSYKQIKIYKHQWLLKNIFFYTKFFFNLKNV